MESEDNPFSDYHSAVLPVTIRKNRNSLVKSPDRNIIEGIPGNSIKERSKLFENKAMLEVKSTLSSPSNSRKANRMSRSMPTSPNGTHLNGIHNNYNNAKKSEEKLDKYNGTFNEDINTNNHINNHTYSHNNLNNIITSKSSTAISENNDLNNDDIDNPFSDSNALNGNVKPKILSPRAHVATTAARIGSTSSNSSKIYSSPIIPSKPLALRASSPKQIYTYNNTTTSSLNNNTNSALTSTSTFSSSSSNHLSSSPSGLVNSNTTYGQKNRLIDHRPISPSSITNKNNIFGNGQINYMKEQQQQQIQQSPRTSSPHNSYLSNQIKKLQISTKDISHGTKNQNPFSPDTMTPSPQSFNEGNSGDSLLTIEKDVNYSYASNIQQPQPRPLYTSSQIDSGIIPTITNKVNNNSYRPKSQILQSSLNQNSGSIYTTTPSKPINYQISSPIQKSQFYSSYNSTSTNNHYQQQQQQQQFLHGSSGSNGSTPPPLPERTFTTKSKINGNGLVSNAGVTSHYTLGSSFDGIDRMPTRRVVINVDSSKSNRAPPYASGYSLIDLSGIKHQMKRITICGQYLFSGNSNLSVFNAKDGKLCNTVEIKDKIKVTSVLIIPGKYAFEEGNKVWAGTDKGEIYEVDIQTKETKKLYEDASSPIIEMFHHNNKIWVISERKIMIWNKEYSANDPDYAVYSSSLSNTYSIRDLGLSEIDIVYVAEDKLWLCNNKTITVLGPYPHISVKYETNLKSNVGKFTCIAMGDKSNHELYTGHDDGKIIIWDSIDVSIKEIFNVSYYNLTSILTVNNNHVWVGLSTGKLCVFNTMTKPWKKIKDFEAHHHSSVCQLVKDPLPPYTSMANSACSVVASYSESGEARFWDAYLSDDYINNLITEQEPNYSERHNVSVYITSWNINSVKPYELMATMNGKQFFDNWFKEMDKPDVVIVGLQELVNLESKTVNAKSFFKKAKKKSKKEKLDNCQQIWVDAIKNNLSEYHGQYKEISCTQMVGLFLCVFIKESMKNSITCQNVVTVETGLKGYHGNKGAIALRLFIEDSSFCIVNTHLAAHQDQVAARNHDIATILKETNFQPHDKPCAYVNGGDGSQIVDYENIFWFGDMNYRIDLQNGYKRDDIIKLVEECQWEKLLSMDQLHTLHTSDPSFPLSFLKEGKINFAPTFKYDINSTEYDTSEKQRVPSWCDRVLFRGMITQKHYKRHECMASDHRPISSSFIVSVKKLNLSEYQRTKNKCFEPCRIYLNNIVNQEKVNWIMDRGSLSKEQAQTLLHTYNNDIDAIIENGELQKYCN